ncbi:CapA family protein [Qaidamihabitans albus]|uniref:CapA family protein n=1 Tax=Qaidamihabitans albus TaxID=2795733 RepID=UPI0018F21CDD|nr:CapA family protein [Qaidamihabitans albus]
MRRPSRRPAAIAFLGATLLAGACTTAPADQKPLAAPAPESTQAAPAESFSVVATGDVLVHPALSEQAATDAEGPEAAEFDFRPLFSGISPLVSRANLALCHLEVPLAEDGGPYSGYPQFNAPPELAGALADTGYDGCSTASNHVLDQGEEGLARTLDVLDEAGIEHTGSARDQEEAETPLILDAGAAKVGHLSYTFGYNGFTEPAGKPWTANELDADAVVAEAEAARAAGAEVVIASLHWGEEYGHEPTEEQRQLAERLLGEDSIDLIIGHHAHVVQPIERIGEKWVAYGLGNSVARHEEPRGVSEEGIAARFRFTRDGERWVVDSAEYVPTLVELGPPIRLVDLTASESTERREEALERIDEIVLSRGGGQDGLTRPGR